MVKKKGKFISEKNTQKNLKVTNTDGTEIMLVSI